MAEKHSDFEQLANVIRMLPDGTQFDIPVGTVWRSQLPVRPEPRLVISTRKPEPAMKVRDLLFPDGGFEGWRSERHACHVFSGEVNGIRVEIRYPLR